MSNASPQKDMWPKIIVGCLAIVLIVSVIAGLGLIYWFAHDYFSPKRAITFEPDYTQISAFDLSDLEKTAEILTARSHYLGHASISFTVNGDNQIVGKVPGYIDTKSLIASIGPIGLVEFVDFGKTLIPVGTVIRTDFKDSAMKQSDGKQWHTVLTNSALKKVSVTKNQYGVYQIAFILTDDGKTIFADFTSANIGTYLGIVKDKVVVSVPRINNPIIDGQGVISGSFTQETANDLAVILRTTPLPIPIILVQDPENE